MCLHFHSYTGAYFFLSLNVAIFRPLTVCANDLATFSESLKQSPADRRTTSQFSLPLYKIALHHGTCCVLNRGNVSWWASDAAAPASRVSKKIRSSRILRRKSRYRGYSSTTFSVLMSNRLDIFAKSVIWFLLCYNFLSYVIKWLETHVQDAGLYINTWETLF